MSEVSMPPVNRLARTVKEPFGPRLAQLRKQRGVTQVDLARRLGIPQSLVCDYERGRLRMHAEFIFAACRILGVGADRLLGLDKREPDGTVIRPRTRRLMESVERLPRHERDMLLRFVQNFVRRTRGQARPRTSAKPSSVPSRMKAQR